MDSSINIIINSIICYVCICIYVRKCLFILDLDLPLSISSSCCRVLTCFRIRRVPSQPSRRHRHRIHIVSSII